MEQKDLLGIFTKLKKILKKYEGKGKFASKLDLDSKYDLWSIKDMVIAGRQRKEIAFAAVIIQSDYVGFYYMPVYTAPEMKKFFSPELLKLLKGKSCFHVKKLDSDIEKQIDDALKKGYELYKKNGWV